MRRVPKAIPCAASTTLTAFVLLVGTLHVLEPSLTPSRHVLSEYVNTGSGPLMVLAFLSWAAALALTGLDAWLRFRATWHRHVLGIFLAVASAGVLLAAAFATQAEGGVLPEGEALSAGGRLHDIGSGVATLAIFGAAAVTASALGTRSNLGRFSVGLIVLALAVQIGLLAVGPEVAGIRQRILVAAACGWQAALLLVRPPNQVCD